jgi:hypothetical protein
MDKKLIRTLLIFFGIPVAYGLAYLVGKLATFLKVPYNYIMMGLASIIIIGFMYWFWDWSGEIK